MAALVRYLTHPEVQIDPQVPVPEWGLSDVGRKRAERLAAAHWLDDVVLIVASRERKAVETAEILARRRRCRIDLRERMHENDRSATGYLPPAEFQQVATQFFSDADRSVRGWETARHAQARIVGEAQFVIGSAPPGDLLLVGHGGVGTLLFCHLSGLEIDRRHDQPGGGGGNVFCFERQSGAVVHGWTPLEAFA